MSVFLLRNFLIKIGAKSYIYAVSVSKRRIKGTRGRRKKALNVRQTLHLEFLRLLFNDLPKERLKLHLNSFWLGMKLKVKKVQRSVQRFSAQICRCACWQITQTCGRQKRGCWGTAWGVLEAAGSLCHSPSAGTLGSCQPCRSLGPNSTGIYNRSYNRQMRIIGFYDLNNRSQQLGTLMRPYSCTEW